MEADSITCHQRLGGLNQDFARICANDTEMEEEEEKGLQRGSTVKALAQQIGNSISHSFLQKPSSLPKNHPIRPLPALPLESSAFSSSPHSHSVISPPRPPKDTLTLSSSPSPSFSHSSNHIPEMPEDHYSASKNIRPYVVPNKDAQDRMATTTTIPQAHASIQSTFSPHSRSDSSPSRPPKDTLTLSSSPSPSFSHSSNHIPEMPEDHYSAPKNIRPYVVPNKDAQDRMATTTTIPQAHASIQSTFSPHSRSDSSPSRPPKDTLTLSSSPSPSFSHSSNHIPEMPEDHYSAPKNIRPYVVPNKDAQDRMATTTTIPQTHASIQSTFSPHSRSDSSPSRPPKDTLTLSSSPSPSFSHSSNHIPEMPEDHYSAPKNIRPYVVPNKDAQDRMATTTTIPQTHASIQSTSSPHSRSDSSPSRPLRDTSPLSPSPSPSFSYSSNHTPEMPEDHYSAPKNVRSYVVPNKDVQDRLATTETISLSHTALQSSSSFSSSSHESSPPRPLRDTSPLSQSPSPSLSYSCDYIPEMPEDYCSAPKDIRPYVVPNKEVTDWVATTTTISPSHASSQSSSSPHSRSESPPPIPARDTSPLFPSHFSHSSSCIPEMTEDGYLKPKTLLPHLIADKGIQDWEATTTTNLQSHGISQSSDSPNISPSACPFGILQSAPTLHTLPCRYKSKNSTSNPIFPASNLSPLTPTSSATFPRFSLSTSYPDIIPTVPKNKDGLSEFQKRVCKLQHQYGVIKTCIMEVEDAIDAYSQRRNNLLPADSIRSFLKLHSIMEVKKIMRLMAVHLTSKALDHEMRNIITFYEGLLSTWSNIIIIHQQLKRFKESLSSGGDLYVRVGGSQHKLEWRNLAKTLGPILTEGQKPGGVCLAKLKDQTMTPDLTTSAENVMIHALTAHFLFQPSIKYFMNIKEEKTDVTLTIIPDLGLAKACLSLHTEKCFSSGEKKFGSPDKNSPLEQVQDLFLKGYVETSRIQEEVAVPEIAGSVLSFPDISIPGTIRCICNKDGFRSGDVIINNLNPKKNLLSIILKNIPVLPYHRIGRISEGLSDFILAMEQRRTKKNKKTWENERYWITTGINL